MTGRDLCPAVAGLGEEGAMNRWVLAAVSVVVGIAAVAVAYVHGLIVARLLFGVVP